MKVRRIVSSLADAVAEGPVGEFCFAPSTAHRILSPLIEKEPQEVFCVLGAAAIIVAHNHPSGDPAPSAEDLAVTMRLRDAGELLGIPVMDHIIVGDDEFVSLRDRGGFPCKR